MPDNIDHAGRLGGHPHILTVPGAPGVPPPHSYDQPVLDPEHVDHQEHDLLHDQARLAVHPTGKHPERRLDREQHEAEGIVTLIGFAVK